MPKIRPPNTRPEKNTANVKVAKPLGQRGVHFQPGNPGRPIGTRVKIGEAFLKDIAKVWETEGIAAMYTMARENSAAFVNCVAGLLPKQVEITEEHIYEIRDTPMNADEWQKSCIIEHEPEIIPESDSVN